MEKFQVATSAEASWQQTAIPAINPPPLDLEDVQLPPLLKKFSWTLAAPFKEEKFHRSVSDTIANNYSPAAIDLAAKFMPHSRDEVRLRPKTGVKRSIKDIDSRPLSPETRKQNLYSKIEKPRVLPALILDPFDLESTNIAKQLGPERRYWYYIEKSIPISAIAPMEISSINAIEANVSKAFINSEKLQKTRKEVLSEIQQSYDIALRKSIVDYILIDPKERERLSIPVFDIPYTPRVVRAPVPWHDSLISVKRSIEQNLYITNPVMLELLKIYNQFKDIKFVDPSVFSANILPTTIDQFQTLLKSQCQSFKTRLLQE